MKFMRTLLAIALVVVALPLTAQEIQINKDNKTIAITTSAEASALADVAIVNIGFQSFGKEQDLTYGEASRISNAIISSLTGAGVLKEAIESAEQTFRPLEPDNGIDRVRYAEGMRFEFTQGWRVTVPAAQAARVLQLAIPAGANQSGAIQWQLRNEDALQSEAARKALEHARQIASNMAQGLGAKLGNLVYASNQTPPRIPFSNLGLGFGSGNGSGIGVQARKIAPLAISPDRITTSATVYAAFAIE